MNRRWLPWALILLAALLFAPLCRTFVREVVVIPLLYILWIAKFLFDTIPQVIIWPFFVLALFLILAAGFIGRRREARRGAAPPLEPPKRVGDWARLIRQADSEDYFKWRLGQQLLKLTLRLIAHRQNQTVPETREQLRRGELEMPPELLAYFQASLQPLGYLAGPPRWQFWKTRPPSPLDLEPGRVVSYLEKLSKNEDPNVN